MRSPGERLDVLVVGAGPAGGRLALQLARAGARVMLADRLADLAQAAFSSAALPLAALQGLGLPEQVIASRWSGWQLLGPAAGQRQWWGRRPLGAVLDFGALRCWQVEQARQLGVELRLGWRAVACGASGGQAMRTWLCPPGSATPRSIESRWVVDASGQARALLGEPAPGQGTLVRGLGVEWLLEVDPKLGERWADRLTFCLGSDWVRQGYGWVFPMAPGQLKVGTCRLLDGRSEHLPLGPELARLLQRLGLDRARVLDRHGGLIRSTVERREAHGHGRLLGLGDAVSTANLLGGEGIRHAMASADVLGPLLLQDGLGPGALLREYRLRLASALGWRWSLSGRLARRIWVGLDQGAGDRHLDSLLRGLETRRAEDLSALLFDYRFERYGLRALPYLLGWR